MCIRDRHEPIKQLAYQKKYRIPLYREISFLIIFLIYKLYFTKKRGKIVFIVNNFTSFLPHGCFNAAVSNNWLHTNRKQAAHTVFYSPQDVSYMPLHQYDNDWPSPVPIPYLSQPPQDKHLHICDTFHIFLHDKGFH